MWSTVNRLKLVKNNGKMILWLLSKQDMSFQPIDMDFKVYENASIDEKANPLIVMHGVLETKAYWDKTCEMFMQKLRNRVYAVDLRNHGESPHTVEHNDQEIAEDLLKFIADQNISKIKMFGQGIGGRAMMFFALKYPQFIERGVILDLLTLSVPHGLRDTVHALLTMKFTQVSLCSSLDECEVAILRNMKDSKNRPELFQIIIQNLRRRENGEYYWAANVDGLLQNLKYISSFMMYIKPMDPLNKPMLFLCGNNSEFVNSKTWPVIKILFPKSEMHWLNVSELAHVHQSAQFCELALKFLCK